MSFLECNRRGVLVAIGALGLLSFAMATTGGGQEGYAPSENVGNPFGRRNVVGTPTTPSTGRRAPTYNVTMHGVSSDSGLRILAEKLRDAQDEDIKKQTETALRERLAKVFDTDMEQRDKELASMQARIDKLKEKLDNRRGKKAEILDLQFKVMVNEANGLGFYTPRQSTVLVDQYNPSFYQVPGTSEPFGESGATYQAPVPPSQPLPLEASPAADPSPAGGVRLPRGAFQTEASPAADPGPVRDE